MFSSQNGDSALQPRPETDRTIIVVGTALLLRLLLIIYALRNFGPSWFFSRGSEMSFLADSFIRGEGLSSPFGVPTGPTAIVAPGYPLLVSFVFWVFGSSTLASALCLMLIGATCNIATVYLIYKSSRQIASERSAFVASIFWAGSLPLIWMPTIFWETNLSALCLMGIVSIFLSVRVGNTISIWLTYGVLCGVTALINPALGPSLLVLAAYTLFAAADCAKRWRCLSAWVIGAVFVYSPWPLRNAQVFHTCVLTRSTIGLELWIGNRPGATGFLETSLFPTYNPNELADYKVRGEIGYTRYKAQVASGFIKAHPARFLQMSALRVVRFWTGTGTQAGSLFFGLHGTLSLIAGAAGGVLLWRTGRKHICVPMFIPLLFFPIPYYVTHAEFRYRLVVDPILTVLMAPTISWLSKKQRSVIHH